MDDFTRGMMNKTSQSLAKLAGLRGVSLEIEVSSNGTYVCNGTDCGPSVHGVYEWLNAQPNVKP